MVHKSDHKPAFANSELWKVRQLKEFRRANNLFLRCGEKYSPTHSCTNNPVGNIHMIETTIVDGGALLSNEMLDLLENTQVHLMDTDDIFLTCYVWATPTEVHSIKSLGQESISSDPGGFKQ